jgi:hypothetical protein
VRAAWYLFNAHKHIDGVPSFPHNDTPICEDNESMTNADKPTECSCHIDIQYFALQDWKKAGHLYLNKISGIVNQSDVLTKALGWILHSRHVCRMMGHFGFHVPL